jgi:hypothetical protein
MSKLTIRELIFSGNMGDGWADENAAADAYAEYLTEQIRAEFPDADISIKVQHNTSGHTAGMFVECDDLEEEDRAQIQCENIGQIAFERFCNSEEAKAFLE